MRIIFITDLLRNNKYGLFVDGEYNINTKTRHLYIKNNKNEKFFWDRTHYDNCNDDNKFLITNSKLKYLKYKDAYNIKYIPFFYSIADYNDDIENIGIVDRSYLRSGREIPNSEYSFIETVSSDLNIKIYDNVSNFPTGEYLSFISKVDLNAEYPFTYILKDDKLESIKAVKYNILISDDDDDKFIINTKLIPMTDTHYIICNKSDVYGVEYINKLCEVFDLSIQDHSSYIILTIERSKILTHMNEIKAQIFKSLIN